MEFATLSDDGGNIVHRRRVSPAAMPRTGTFIQRAPVNSFILLGCTGV